MGATAGTCTMGDDGRFIASIIYSVPIVILVGYGLWNSRKLEGFSVYSLILTIASAIFAAYFWIPLLWNTTIMGNHLCGEMFNDFIVGSYVLERFVPLIHMFYIGLLIVLSKPLFKRDIK